jgi:hypothetical protein
MLDRAFRQGIDEDTSIIFGEEPFVQHYYYPSVALGADKTAKPLSEAKNGLGNGVLAEGVFVGLAPGGDDGVVGNGEGKPGDY